MSQHTDHDYYHTHLITYIGNKRRLLEFLDKAFSGVQKKIGKKAKILDGFSGSGVVSRLLKKYAFTLISNDIEEYTYTINKAYLANKSTLNIKKIHKAIDYLNAHKLKPTKSDYFITNHYAPKNDKKINPGERVFYTRQNAQIIDNIRYMIDHDIDTDVREFCLAQLLIKASIHNNTSGVFKGFHKKDGVGHFGGTGENALVRIMKEITLDYPIFSEYECEVQVEKQDINAYLKKKKQKFDIVYYDPPYNQHPYGSNYFMLNIINGGKPVEIQDEGVSGIAKKRYKSDYNSRQKAIAAMDELIKNTNAKYILISYNNEGIIPFETFKKIVSSYGKYTLKTQSYNTYRGSRNLKNRDNKVQEMLWILEKK